MKIWATLSSCQRIVSERVISLDYASLGQAGDWTRIISDICNELDISRPIILKKHLNDLYQFSRVVFRPADFIEPVRFEQFSLEVYDYQK